jgi:outer membrane protein assembly factor BamD
VNARLLEVLRALLPAAALALAACASAPPEPELAELPPAEELYQQGVALLEERRELLGLIDLTPYQDAIDKFQEVVDNYPYSEYAVFAELRIADAYYDQERWDEALSYYRDFAELHPDHPRVPYALYRAGLCFYQQSKEPGRDQSATHQAVLQFDDLMRRYPDAPESREAEALWRELRTRLGNHVMQIGDFYLDRDEFQSAADRYRAVLNGYPGLGLDPEALYKLGVCYERMNLTDEASRIFQVILDNYGDTEVAESAAEFLPPEQVPSAN